MTSVSDEKWRPINSIQVQGTGGSLTGPQLENRVGDKDNGKPRRPVSSRLHIPVRWGIVVKEQDPSGDLPVAFFLLNVL
jgi:hypothetical protein